MVSILMGDFLVHLLLRHVTGPLVWPAVILFAAVVFGLIRVVQELVLAVQARG